VVKFRFAVKPNSRSNAIETGPDGNFRIKIKAPPVDGKANEEICRFLAEIFVLSSGRVVLQSGFNSKYKTALLDMEESEFHNKLKELIA
jgi:hypothetical protein